MARVQTNPIRQAFVTLLRAPPPGEEPVRLPLPSLGESAFRQYVRDRDDVAGMIAYALYKFQKIECLEQNAHLSHAERELFCQKLGRGRNYAGNVSAAEAMLCNLEKETISAFVKQKTKRDIYVGIVSGIVSALLAPILFSAFLYAVKLSGVAQNPFL